MPFRSFHHAALLGAALAVLTWFVPGTHVALAVPLTADASSEKTETTRRLSDIEVVEPSPGTLETSPGQPIAITSGPQHHLEHPRGPGAHPSTWTFQEFTQGGDGSSIADAFRPFVNLNPQGPLSPQNERVGNSARPRDNPDMIMFGADMQEWMDEAVRGIVSSAIELRVDEQGRASFSVLGMGDFGVMVSGDRNEFALVSGSNVLFTAQRNPNPEHASYGSGARSDYGGAGMSGSGRPVDSYDESPLRQAMELVAEIATHPLSLLVYFIIGAYVLLWNILSRQATGRLAAADLARVHHAEAPRPKSARRRRSRRSRRTQA